MKIWLNVTFESSCYRTQQYKQFEQNYKNYIKKNLPQGFELHQFNPNHFEFSAVIQTPKGKYIYLSISDVRYSSNWYDNILIRRMKHDHDWTGGRNHYTSLDDLYDDLLDLSDEELPF